jgi:hypothetical protein
MLPTRDEVVRYIEEYIRENQIPIRYGDRLRQLIAGLAVWRS